MKPTATGATAATSKLSTMPSNARSSAHCDESFSGSNSAASAATSVLNGNASANTTSSKSADTYTTSSKSADTNMASSKSADTNTSSSTSGHATASCSSVLSGRAPYTSSKQAHQRENSTTISTSSTSTSTTPDASQVDMKDSDMGSSSSSSSPRVGSGASPRTPSSSHNSNSMFEESKASWDNFRILETQVIKPNLIDVHDHFGRKRKRGIESCGALPDELLPERVNKRLRRLLDGSRGFNRRLLDHRTELRNMSPRDFQKTVESLREDALALKFDEAREIQRGIQMCVLDTDDIRRSAVKDFAKSQNLLSDPPRASSSSSSASVQMAEAIAASHAQRRPSNIDKLLYPTPPRQPLSKGMRHAASLLSRGGVPPYGPSRRPPFIQGAASNQVVSSSSHAHSSHTQQSTGLGLAAHARSQAYASSVTSSVGPGPQLVQRGQYMPARMNSLSYGVNAHARPRYVGPSAETLAREAKIKAVQQALIKQGIPPDTYPGVPRKAFYPRPMHTHAQHGGSVPLHKNNASSSPAPTMGSASRATILQKSTHSQGTLSARANINSASSNSFLPQNHAPNSLPPAPPTASSVPSLPKPPPSPSPPMSMSMSSSRNAAHPHILPPPAASSSATHPNGVPAAMPPPISSPLPPASRPIPRSSPSLPPPPKPLDLTPMPSGRKHSALSSTRSRQQANSSSQVGESGGGNGSTSKPPPVLSRTLPPPSSPSPS